MNEQNNTNAEENQSANFIADSGEILGKYSEEEYTKIISDSKSEIDSWIEYAKDKSNFNELKSQAVELKEKIKAKFLKDEDNKNLNSKIDELITQLNEKQNEEREKADEIYNQNYDAIKDKALSIIEDSYKTENFKDARESLIALQNEIKEVKLRKSVRDDFQNKINDAFQDVIKRQSVERENYEMECIENYHNIKGKVEEAIEFSHKTNNFGQARQKFINIQNDIKGKNLKREQREELYQAIRDNFESLNTRQESEREQFISQCNDNYDKLQIVVNEAIEFAKTTENYSDARQRLINAQTEIKGIKLTREQRDKLYGDIRLVFNTLNEQQTGEREDFEKEAAENYDKVSRKINEAFELVHGVSDFRLIRETLIAVQGEVKILKFKREHRNELFARIREAFSIFDKKKDEFFNKRREEKTAKLNSLKDSLNEKLARFENLLKIDNDALSNFEAKLSEAAEELKEEFQNKINSIAAKITDKEKMVNEIKVRIDDIEKEIADVEKKK